MSSEYSENRLLEKRFIITTLALILTAGMLWAGRLGAEGFEQIIIWVVGLFVAGGTSDKWAQYYTVSKAKVLDKSS